MEILGNIKKLTNAFLMKILIFDKMGFYVPTSLVIFIDLILLQNAITRKKNAEGKSF